MLALDGVMDASLAITLDALRTANAFAARAGRGGGLTLTVAASRKIASTGGGMRLAADVTVDELLLREETVAWLLVPGMGMTSAPEIAARLARKDARLAMELLKRPGLARRIGASCSSVFLLAAAGVLARRGATTTWWLAQHFRERHPEVRLDETQMLVRDGRYVTAGSAFAQLDLVLAVITDVLGAAVAHLCSKYLLIDHRPSQARYMIPSHVRHVDATVLAAERWIDANLGRQVSVTDLASALAVSPKTLSRRIAAATGVSPVRFLQRRRLQQATVLLETTSLTIEEVAWRVGYQDGTALRKIVKREFGVTPGALRGVRT